MEPNTPQAIAAAWDHLCDTYADDLEDLGGRKALAALELAAIRDELGCLGTVRILAAGCGTESVGSSGGTGTVLRYAYQPGGSLAYEVDMTTDMTMGRRMEAAM